jgi:molybdate transport system substrate-binding protein
MRGCPTLSLWPGALLLALALVLPARAEPESLRVLAAASLTEVVEALGRRFEGARVVPGFGASSELARQIADGAPADVFVSASPEWIDFLREAQALDGEARLVARNRLVAIAPAQSPLPARGVRDPASLLAQLRAGERVAIADAVVPAGESARQALAKQGLLEAFLARLVGLKDVRAVLRAVEQGELEAGFVYASDARIAAVERLFEFDPARHAPIEILAVALRGAARPGTARRFVAFLASDTARALLSDAGFELP